MKRAKNPLDINSVRCCHKCPTLSADHVPSAGDPNAALMLIGRDPGATEVELGIPFVGPSGEIIDALLDEAKWDRSDTYIANAVKCRTPNNRGPHQEELSMCSRMWLYEEIGLVSPRVLVVFGRDAHSAVFHTIPFKHGGEIPGQGAKRTAIMAYHPGYILRGGMDLDLYVPTIGALIRKCLDDTEATQ